MKGAAGPSGFDANDWRDVIGSRSFGKSSTDLCDAIARMTKALCTEDRTVEGGLSALVAGRLIPLDKDPGLRPIGRGSATQDYWENCRVHLETRATRRWGRTSNVCWSGRRL